jgi:regulator of sigma E protease
VTWVLAIAGFCALIVLHEAGHFFAAKAVGMRVEKFSLFFPPKIIGFKRGETEYRSARSRRGGT